MENVSILKVRDKDEDQEALAIIRPVNGFVALSLSLEHGADVQVVFTPSECEELISRLQMAVTEVRSEALVTGSGTSNGNRSGEPAVAKLVSAIRNAESI